MKYLFSILLLLSLLASCRQAPRTGASACLLDGHFGIPYFDLSADSSRQFVVARKEGVYYGHPTTVKVRPSGQGEAILAAFPTGAHARGLMTIRKSMDGGRSWTEDMPAAAALGDIREVPTIHAVQGPEGKERLILFTGLYPIRISVSEDFGEHWTPFRPVGDWGGIVAMSDLIPVKDNPEDEAFAPGKYLAFFHDDGRFISGGGEVYRNPGKFVLYKTLSVDGGLSWAYPEVIREDSLRYICEPGIIRSPDGRELAMLLRENSRRFNAQIMFSRDEGRSWTEPRPLPAALCGDRHVLRYAPDGRIAAVFRDYQRRTAKGPTEGDFVAWIGAYEDLANGAEGQYRLRLLKNYQGYDCGYAGLEVLEDGSLLAVTYLQYRVGDEGNNSVVAVRFRLDEVDDMARGQAE